MKAKRPPRVTEAQSNWLRRIAQAGGMMVRYRQGEAAEYALLTGHPIPITTAEVLIRNGWLVSQKDGLFPGDSQTYKTLRVVA